MKVYNKQIDKIVEIPKVIKGTPTINGVSEELLNANGYYYIEYESKPDRRYYTSEEATSLVGNKYIVSYTKAEVDVEQLKTTMISDIKALQAKKLGAIDWYWLRELKIGVSVPQTIQDEAEYIYNTSSAKEAEITALCTIEDCITYENEPYNYTYTQEDIDGLSDMGECSLSVGDTVVMYKNNTKDW